MSGKQGVAVVAIFILTVVLRAAWEMQWLPSDPIRLLIFCVLVSFVWLLVVLFHIRLRPVPPFLILGLGVVIAAILLMYQERGVPGVSRFQNVASGSPFLIFGLSLFIGALLGDLPEDEDPEYL